MSRLILAGAFVVTVTATILIGCSNRASLRSELFSAIGQMIELLEENKIDEFLEKYIDPQKLQNHRRTANFPKFVQEIRRNAPSMAQELKDCQALEPSIDERRGTAFFESPQLPAAGVRFHYVQGIWRLGD